MSKVYWAAAFTLVAFLIPAPITADDVTFQVANPLPLAPAPGADLGPIIAVNPEGQVSVAWKHVAPDASKAELMLASSPDWTPAVVASLDPARLDETSLALRNEAGITLAWSQPATVTQTLLQQTWPLPPSPEPETWELPLNARWAVDSHGFWHAAWVEKGAIHAISNASPMTITLPVSPTTIVTGLTLAIDSQDAAHLGWALQDRDDNSLGVYYAPVISGTQPIRVAPSGQLPHLVVGPAGRAHLFWVDGDGLKYANSTNWAETSLVSPGFPATQRVALAMGTDEGVHLAWTDGETLWRVHSADWRVSLQRLPTPANPRDLAMATDRFGRLHLVWAAANPEDEGRADLAYLRPLPFALQVEVVNPQEGDVLTGDSQARAVTNGPAENILRIEFYLQASTSAEAELGALRSLGIDRDGRDGWSVALRVGDLEPWLRFRVLALATTTKGSLIRAWGGWFTVQRADLPGVWFQVSDSDLDRGAYSLSALLASQPGQLRRLDLYLAPATCAITDTVEEPACLPADSLYLGSYEPLIRGQWPAADWQQFAYDHQHVPNGLYRPVAVAVDDAGNRLCERSRGLVAIDETMPPRIEVTAPAAGAVIDDELRITARATDDDGTVLRVDFYLERSDVLLQSPGPGATPAAKGSELLWLGSDTDGEDGWDLRVAVRPDLDGDSWRVQAVAFDEQGLSTVAHSSGTVAILGRHRPYLATLLPSEGSRVWGIQPISLFVTSGLQYLARAELFLEDGDGAWTYLGTMSEVIDRLAFDWDTRAWPDGDYALIVVAHHTDGHQSQLRCGNLSVQNGSSFYLLREPAPGKVLTGTVPLRVAASSHALPLKEARFYYRLPGAALVPIARVMAGVTPEAETPQGETPQGETPQGEAPQGEIPPGAPPREDLTALWYTNTVLDGDYELVSILVDDQGTESQVVSRVTVRNATPAIAFRDFRAQAAWSGSKQISWQASSPVGKPLSVTMEYSPDGGTHWLAPAKEITATSTFSWRTDAYPDSLQGLLRLTATDGVLSARSVSPPFAVNNNNESPQVRLLGPLSGRSYAGLVPITWRATDPDGDVLMIDIAYRGSSGEWTNLAQRAWNTGYYLWDTQGLAPGEDYEVRVTALDARSATVSDSASNVRLVANKAPQVLLMWPHGGARLQREAIILWRATDEDNDGLRIDLYYSDNAGQTWIPLAEDVPNTGYYQWQVSFFPLGTQYRVRVVARDRFLQAEDQSDGVFAVGQQTPPTVRLVYPPAGAEIRGIQPVRWSRADDDSSEARVDLMARRSSQAEGATHDWLTIAENVPDDGFFLWNTRSFADGEYDLKLVIRNGESDAESMLPQPLRVANARNHAPGVALLAPQGGEIWSGWREIAWRAWDGDGGPITATVSISSDGGQHWISLVNLDARAGHALWDTRTVPSGENYWLSIAATDGQATARVLSGAPVHIVNGAGYPPSVVLPAPQTSGSTERRTRVSWIADDIDGDALAIGLALSGDGGLSWREVASNLFDAGQYTLEATLAALQGHRLRLRADDGIYRVESFVSLPTPQPPEGVVSLAWVSPRGGERWSGQQEIRWQADAPAGRGWTLDVDCSRDGGQNWTGLASGLSDTSFLWNTQALPNGTYFLRLTLRTEQMTSSLISEPLTLDNPGQHGPVVSLLSPRGGEAWWGTREVRWRATDPDGDPLTISVAYSVDCRATWNAMTFSSDNTGSYIWDTTTVPNMDEIWFRVTASDGQSTAVDISDGPLAIYNHYAPIVALLSPAGGEQWAGVQSIAWLATRERDRPVQVAVQASMDMGKTWQTLVEGLPAQGSYLWDTSALPDQSRVLIRVRATDAQHSAIDMVPRPVILRNHPQPGVPFFLP